MGTNRILSINVTVVFGGEPLVYTWHYTDNNRWVPSFLYITCLISF